MTTVISRPPTFDCASFVEHWKSLRTDGPTPTLDDWLTHLPVAIASHKFRAELLPDDALVLFSGSALIERRGENNTGASLYAREPGRQRTGVANLRTVAAWPCGLRFEVTYDTTAGRALNTQTVILPLAVPLGRWPQVVGFSIDLSERAVHERLASAGRNLRKAWIDVGAGLPEKPPL